MIFWNFCRCSRASVRIAFALIGPCQSEFRRRVKRKNRQRRLKRRNRGIVLLQLRIQIADEIKRIRLARRDFASHAGTLRSLFRVRPCLCKPGPGCTRRKDRAEAFPIASSKAFLASSDFCWLKQRNSEIEFRQRVIRLRLQRSFKLLLRVGKSLLVHVRDADAVEPRSFGKLDQVAGCGPRSMNSQKSASTISSRRKRR